MSDRGSGQTEAVISLAPKLNARPDPSDPLEKAGLLILDMVGQAACIAEANYQQGRNPATGEAIKIKASKKVAFRAAKDLKMAV
jgi:DNA-binding protein HU-beta